MTQLKTNPCPPDLLESVGLLAPADAEIGASELRAPNSSLRIFVASYMLSEPGMSCTDSLIRARDLYSSFAFDLRKPGLLTQADIEREVWELVDRHNEAESSQA